uniref:Uncharacterized protein n=1 Tax=Anguilla anguilla TaxID=7936 RepID=A0A0E9TRT8_ANGAN
MNALCSLGFSTVEYMVFQIKTRDRNELSGIRRMCAVLWSERLIFGP